MAVKLNISKLWDKLDYPPWDYLDNSPAHRPDALFIIRGQIGEWLHHHGHNQIFYGGDSKIPEYWMVFNDPDLAMLFKLTWL